MLSLYSGVNFFMRFIILNPTFSHLCAENEIHKLKFFSGFLLISSSLSFLFDLDVKLRFFISKILFRITFL